MKEGKMRNNLSRKRKQKYSFYSNFWSRNGLFMRSLRRQLFFPDYINPKVAILDDYVQLISYDYEDIHIRVMFECYKLENISIRGCCGRYTGLMLNVLHYLGRTGGCIEA